MGPDSAPPVLGLDIGGTKLAVGVVTCVGEVHGLQVQPTDPVSGPDAVLERLFAMGRQALEIADVGPVAAVGISCGGPLDAARGVLLGPPHLPGWIDVAVTERARNAFGVPTTLANDATAAALAEYWYGAGRGTSSMLYLTLSTGVGGGAVLDGRLYRGAYGNGAEFGHIQVRSDGRRCSCGRRGCVEAYASGTNIARRAREAVTLQASGTTAHEPASSLHSLAAVTAADVAAAARAGDRLAGRVWAETVELLAVALVDLVNIFGPDAVVLGGGVTRSGALLLDPLRALVAAQAMAPAAHAARIDLTALGDVVGVVGAAAVAMSASPGLSEPSAASRSPSPESDLLR